MPDADKKVQSLTSMLLQRQSMLEAVVAEKNSLALQLEREKVSLTSFNQIQSNVNHVLFIVLDM